MNILGKEYKIEYSTKRCEVDPHGFECLWGQVELHSRTIRVYDCGRETGDVLDIILHEAIHAIADELKIKLFDSDRGHDDLSILATALADTLTRNGWIREDERREEELICKI